MEATDVHGYGLAGAFLILIVSWEVATLASKVDVSVTHFPLEDCAGWAAGGARKWLAGKSLRISAFVAALLIYRHSEAAAEEQWAALDWVLYAACFYRYSHGLLERVLGEAWAKVAGKQKKGKGKGREKEKKKKTKTKTKMA